MIRRAVIGDAPALADVHVRAWQAAYRGMMPDAVLDGLDVADRERHWAAWLSGPHNVLVVEDDAGAVAGFAATGAARGDDGYTGLDRAGDGSPTDVGELYAINLAPEHWGRGLGRDLLAAATEQLRAGGFSQSILWVVDANQRARRFYEIAGWTADGTEKVDAELSVREVLYRRRL